jgi:hypothetical protein
LKKVNEKRIVELDVLWSRLKLGMMSMTMIYFFPSVLSAVVFSIFIGTGHKLDLSVAYTVITIFNNLKV